MKPFPSHGGGPRFVDHHSQQPAWKRMHRSPFFWVSALFIAIATIVFILTPVLAP